MSRGTVKFLQSLWHSTHVALPYVIFHSIKNIWHSLKWEVGNSLVPERILSLTFSVFGQFPDTS